MCMTLHQQNRGHVGEWEQQGQQEMKKGNKTEQWGK